MKILIVTGGFVNTDLLKKVVSSEEFYIIGADKGLKYLDEADITPDLAIGDFDSLDSSTAEYYKKLEKTVILKPEKDFTDTHAALYEAFKLNPEKIIILGATGTRLDHTMANISLLKNCCDRDIEAEIIDENNRIRVVKDKLTLKKENAFGNYISFMPLGDKASSVTLKGFKYNVSDKTFEQGNSLGISNEIEDDYVSVSIKEGCLIMMETRD